MNLRAKIFTIKYEWYETARFPEKPVSLNKTLVKFINKYFMAERWASASALQYIKVVAVAVTAYFGIRYTIPIC